MTIPEIQQKIEGLKQMIAKGRNVKFAQKRIKALEREMEERKMEERKIHKVCPVCGAPYTEVDGYLFHDEHWNQFRTTLICSQCADIWITPPWDYEAIAGIPIKGNWLLALSLAELADGNQWKQDEQRIIQKKRAVYRFLIQSDHPDAKKLLQAAHDWMQLGWGELIKTE